MKRTVDINSYFFELKSTTNFTTACYPSGCVINFNLFKYIENNNMYDAQKMKKGKE